MYDDKLTFTKLLQAHKRARKGKRFKREVIKFEMDFKVNRKWNENNNRFKWY